jgi:hypothetical protein
MIYLQLLLQKALHPSLNRTQILCRRNIILASSLPARERQILGHNAIDVYSVNTSLLQALSKSHNLWSAVQLSSLYQASCPGKDGRNGVGGGLVALLVLAVMAGDGAVGGFGFEGFAVGGDEDGGHES